MKIGIFGGSFDPVHLGHLILAEQCREKAGLDEVWIVPAATSPLKPDGPIAKSRQRVEMLQLATAGHDNMHVSSIEIERGETSFTIDTLRTIHQERPQDALFLLLGSDSLTTFDKWKEPEAICEIATPLIVARRGFEISTNALVPFCDAARAKEIRDHQISDLPVVEISSTVIRESVKQGRSIRYLTPRPVEMYILTNGLYSK